MVGLALCGLGACSGSHDMNGVVSVGADTISSQTLAHWTAVLHAGAGAGEGKTSRRRALEYLIASRWLLAEAEARGIRISTAAIHRQIQQLVGGEPAQLHSFLQLTGETRQDVELQARDELASTKLRSLVIGAARPITNEEIAAYYMQHRSSFRVPERRKARFTYRQTRASAETAKREAEAGKSLASPAQRAVKEIFLEAQVPPLDAIEEAIDKSKPHVVSGPYHISHSYAVYQVVRVTPAHFQPLADVSSSIRGRLLHERNQRSLDAFARKWTAEWRDKTRCRPGYVIGLCSEYRGSTVTSDPFHLTSR
jgi:foldase protein PrsA